MPELLKNYLTGQWVEGTASGTPLIDPITGEQLVRIDATELDLEEGFNFARQTGGSSLRAMTYLERGKMLSDVLKVLKANRADYYDISTANSGTVKNDSAVDIEGGIFTLGHFARLGESLGDRKFLLDGEAVSLAKDAAFQSQHIMTPTHGLALFINAFNFPAWGLWEKAAPALLSGVPVIIKPASSTAWLTHRMVKDIVDAGILPIGALSIICGRPEGLLEQLKPFDVVSFTGSAETGATIRSHPTIAKNSIRVNIEADSINSAMLLPESDSSATDLFIKEVAREMTVKSGQKCTAIRRIFVPESHYESVASGISARLKRTLVGNPKNEEVRMGAVVNQSQLSSITEGLALLKTQARVIYDGAEHELLNDSDACCIAPTLLGVSDGDAANIIHDTEVFGPVATLIPYRDTSHAITLIRRGEGSLVTSLYGNNNAELAQLAVELGDCNGRIHIITPDVAAIHTGHGNVMPQSLHGGPGRAGGGEELGGLRALNFYHQRTALQASPDVLKNL